MRLNARRVLLTGASGGIGHAAALAMAQRGAHVLLSGRSRDALEALADEIRGTGGRADVLVADLLAPDGPRALIEAACAFEPRVDVLVNCAGTSAFALFENTTDDQLDRLWRSNVQAPMRLVQHVLPVMRARGQGLIVNVGSIFGSIGFPCFAGYSATKFALRGFSEALRRELKGSGIDVLYFAPRYTRTALNGEAVQRMATALRMNQDEPAQVAKALVASIEGGARERLLGASERFFVRLNQLLPSLVDGALARQSHQMRPYAIAAPASPLLS